MKKKMLVSLFAWAIALNPVRAEFVGTLEFTPTGCEAEGLCIIKSDFEYKYPKGVRWQTKANDKTDGASIPPWARPFVGQPFERDYLKAAVIHDHYCDWHVRPWRQTHRVFYDALLESGVSESRAKLLYYAVYLGGPKWAELIPGIDCGPHCIMKAEIDRSMGESSNMDRPLGKASKSRNFVTRPARYTDPGFSTELEAVEKLIAESGGKVDLLYLEKRAENLNSNDIFYKSGDKIMLGGSRPAIE